MRRLLAFQLMLTKKRGLPKSRLLTLKEADARQSKREESMWMQEESASPLLRRRQASMVKADKEKVNDDFLDLEKEEEGNISVGTLLPMQNCKGLLPPSFYNLPHVGPLHASDDLLHTLTL